MPAKSQDDKLSLIIRELERISANQEKIIDEQARLGRLTDKHELELHGPRGVYDAILALAGQLTWNNRALWTIAAAAIIGALLTVLGLHQ